MATIDVAAFSGTAIFSADGATTTNSFTGTFVCTGVNWARDHNGALRATLDLESDGAVTVNGFTATGTSAVDVAGFGGNMSLVEGTSSVVAYTIAFDSWSMKITPSTFKYTNFDSQWQKSKITTFAASGSATGIAKTGQAVPVT